MRRRISMVSYTTAAAIVVAGLGAGLGLGAGVPGGGGGLTAGALASVANCGPACFSLYTRRLGSGSTMNVAMAANNGTGGKVGRKLNLGSAADKLPDGDFMMSFTGQVSQFCGTDPADVFGPDSYICSHDSNFAVFEAQWSPYGNSTGLCAGVAASNVASESVTLRSCGVSAHTLWIADAAHGTGGGCQGAGHFCPWMNASDNSFRTPQVLTMDGSTSAPADQLRLAPMNLRTISNKSRAWANQLFAFAPNPNS